MYWYNQEATDTCPLRPGDDVVIIMATNIGQRDWRSHYDQGCHDGRDVLDLPNPQQLPGGDGVVGGVHVDRAIGILPVLLPKRAHWRDVLGVGLRGADGEGKGWRADLRGSKGSIPV